MRGLHQPGRVFAGALIGLGVALLAVAAQETPADPSLLAKEAKQAYEARRLDEALSKYEQAFAAAEGLYRGTRSDFFLQQMLNNQGVILVEQGKYEDADVRFSRSLSLYLKKPAGEQTLGHFEHLAETQNWLGWLDLRLRGDYFEAKKRFDSSIDVWSNHYLNQRDANAARQANLAMVHNHLALMYYEVGLHSKALSHYEQARSILQQRGDWRLAIVLNNLAQLHHSQGQFTRAKELFGDALAVLKARTGAAAWRAQFESNLAWTCHSTGDVVGAEQHYRTSRQHWESEKTPDRRDLARTISNHGWLRHSLGELPAARKDYEESLAHRMDPRTGADDREIGLGLANLALLHVAEGDWAQAQARMTQACKRSRQYLARRLPILPEEVQIAYLLRSHQHDSHAAFLHSAISIGVSGAEQKDMAALSAEWAINGKAIAQEALAQREVEARDSADPRARELFQLRERRSTLAFFKNGGALSEDEFLKLESHAHTFGKRVASRAASESELWAPLARIQEQLPASHVLVEIARFRRWDFTGKQAEKWGPLHYAAWVIPSPSAGPVRLIDLGPADAIEKAVEQVQAVFKKAEELTADKKPEELIDGPDKENESKAALERLASLTLWRLLPALGSARHWIISPDHALWLAPWSAFPLRPAGPYAVEEHTVSYVNSGRDLIRSPVAVSAGPPLIFANPKYNLGLANAGALRIPPMGPLPGTTEEAQRVAPFVAQLTQQEKVEPVLERDALEARVKSAKHPQILVLSTHGFFLPGNEL